MGVFGCWVFLGVGIRITTWTRKARSSNSNENLKTSLCSNERKKGKTAIRVSNRKFFL